MCAQSRHDDEELPYELLRYQFKVDDDEPGAVALVHLRRQNARS